MSETIIIDPGVFAPEAIDDETAQMNKMIEDLLATQSPTHEREPQEVREERESGKSWLGPIKRVEEARDRVIRSQNLDVPVRLYIPDEVTSVFLHIHGGGFVLMRPFYFDEALLDMAKRCRTAIVSVDYRLAPENPYPAAPDDCEAVAVWLAENAESEFGTDQLYIGGESAGANLAVVTLLRLRDKHRFTGFSKAVLTFGCFDATMTPSQRNWGDRNLILSTPLMKWFFNLYVPEEKRRDPDVSPLYANLSDLPSALFTVGTLDPLLDDSLFTHARWVASGNKAELAVYPGGIHGFTAFPIKIGQDANKKIFEFLSEP